MNDLGVASTHTLPYDLAQHTSCDALTACSCSGLLRAQESFKICIFSQSSGYTAHPLPRHSLKVAGQTTHLRTPVDPRLCKQRELKTLPSAALIVNGPENQAGNGNPPPRKNLSHWMTLDQSSSTGTRSGEPPAPSSFSSGASPGAWFSACIC